MKIKHCWRHLLYADVNSFFATRKCQKIEKLPKIDNIEEENIHSSERVKEFQWNFEERSGLWLYQTIRVSHFLWKTHFCKNHRGKGQIDPTPLSSFRVNWSVSVTSRLKMIASNRYGRPKNCPQKIIKREFFCLVKF